MCQIVKRIEMEQLPYGSLSTAPQRTRRNNPALMEINKKLVRELREIARHQILLMEFSELVSHQTSDDGDLPHHTRSFSPDAIDRYFEVAIAGVCEFGRKTSEAQVRALTASRAQSRGGVKMRMHMGGYIQAAA